MQQADDKANQHAAPGGGGEAAADPNPLSNLEQQIQQLDSQISSLDTAIADGQGKVSTAQSDLDNTRSQRQALDKRRTDLQRLVDGANSDRAKLAQQRQAAREATTATRTWLAQVCAELEAELAKARRDEIDKAIKAVNDKTAQLDADTTEKQKKVDAATADLAGKKDAAQKADTALRDVQNQLRGLAGEIQAAQARVKTAQAALKKAYDSGQTQEAYLLADDLERALSWTETLLDPAEENKRAQQLADAWKASQTAAQDVSTAEATLKQLQQDLAGSTNNLLEYKNKRRQKIDEALAQATAPAPAPPAEQHNVAAPVGA